MSSPAREAIDNDPELYHGLTWWSTEPHPEGLGPIASAQIRDHGLAVTVVDDHGVRLERELPAADARRLRDLLNIATARGYL